MVADTINIAFLPVAAARIAFNDTWGVITKICVGSNHRRQGIGRSITQAMVDSAREHNCSKLTHKVDTDNAAAVSLFAALGSRNHHRDRYRALTQDHYPA